MTLFDTQASNPKIGQTNRGWYPNIPPRMSPNRSIAAPGFVALFLSDAVDRCAGQGVPRGLRGTLLARMIARRDR